MTTQQETGAETGQSVNGHAPAEPAEPAELLEPDTGERWLGILVIAAGCFLLIVGFDRVTGGRITGAFNAGQ